MQEFDASTSETPVSNEVVLAEVRGLASTVTVQFEGVRREQNDMKDWMGRLSDSLERQSNVVAKFIGIETRMGSYEAEQSDVKLELESMKESLGKIERENVKTHFLRGGIFSALGLAFGAVVTVGLETFVGRH